VIDCTFVTYRELPDLDPDDRLAADALQALGVRIETAVWNDPRVDWTQTRTCVLRSTWDYPLRIAEFLGWVCEVSKKTSLWNPAQMVRWNCHKFYLRDLAERGVEIVPTAWLRRGDAFDLASLMRERGWTQCVVKPAHGAGTVGVRKVDSSREAIAEGQEHTTGLLAEQDVLVQPYLNSIGDYPERALVFIDGAYSHAVSKTPFQALLPAGEAGEQPVVATVEEVEAATKAMAAVAGRQLYGRVDLVRDDAGAPVVIELELIEPSLFLAMHPPAAKAFAEAIARVVDS
jgi:glutathione synthase/RimK-type ligase-like ATP-grasp enzyme